ncbi:conserved hypothetical protein (DUF1572) [Formosa agariphila KMM 3901]|uniref:DinB superfamily protein n=1 Tax=Formosa agariphila (strain DSM 15362 / KCTC 12365 / LMG 23005 / KMM 3901 / M-2Alg 35-1) TaxID=1347342 RepID=T2KP18_FORAG|nr:DUF1572 family protein [Formosa agariphila]CDF80208.1 conserved hypothetical protein (DUF1572) [Formosa agariphila KMM 3901]
MNKNELIQFFERDLKQLITELELYSKEENIWRVEKNISNSAGNLTLHIIGNLHTFIGKEIGKTGYVRHRELEFTQKNVPRPKLIKAINETIEMIRKSLVGLTDEELKMDYPIMKFPKVESNEYLLVHLMNHLSYHLGQINYHRRLIGE